MLLIQADGASKGNPGPASYGAVLFWGDGSLALELFDAIGIATNNHAEYRAVIAGLEAAKQLALEDPGLRTIHIQMDSKLVVEQLSGRWKIKNSDLQQLAIYAQQLMRDFEVKLEWIPREMNSHADELANRALRTEILTPVSSEPFGVIQPKSVRAPRQRSKPVVVWAIRHGHTEMTESGLISGGGTNPGLSEFGHTETERIAAEIRRISQLFDLPLPTSVLHSPQLRATETASKIAREFDLVPVAEPNLREIEFGSWEGLSMENLSGISAAEVSRWRGSMDYRPPEGESVQDMETRVGLVLENVVAEQRESVAIVAHMMPMRAIYRAATKASAVANWSTNFLPASVSVYRFFGLEFAEVFAVNSTGHLQPAPKKG